MPPSFLSIIHKLIRTIVVNQTLVFAEQNKSNQNTPKIHKVLGCVAWTVLIRCPRNPPVFTSQKCDPKEFGQIKTNNCRVKVISFESSCAGILDRQVCLPNAADVEFSNFFIHASHTHTHDRSVSERRSSTTSNAIRYNTVFKIRQLSVEWPRPRFGWLETRIRVDLLLFFFSFFYFYFHFHFHPSYGLSISTVTLFTLLCLFSASDFFPFFVRFRPIARSPADRPDHFRCLSNRLWRHFRPLHLVKTIVTAKRSTKWIRSTNLLRRVGRKNNEKWNQASDCVMWNWIKPRWFRFRLLQ